MKILIFTQMYLHSENPIFYSLSLREVGWPAGPVSVSALSHFNATNVCRFPPFCEYLHEEAEEGARREYILQGEDDLPTMVTAKCLLI